MKANGVIVNRGIAFATMACWIWRVVLCNHGMLDLEDGTLPPWHAESGGETSRSGSTYWNLDVTWTPK